MHTGNVTHATHDDGACCYCWHAESAAMPTCEGAPALATRHKSTCNTAGTSELQVFSCCFRQGANLHTRMYGKPLTASHAESPEQPMKIEIGACPLSEQFQAIHDTVVCDQNVAKIKPLQCTNYDAKSVIASDCKSSETAMAESTQQSWCRDEKQKAPLLREPDASDMFACLAAVLAGGNFCDQEFCQGLPVSILPLIMLLGLHLVHNDLLTFQLL